MSDWYYAHDGQQKGPVPVSELQRLADNGEFDSGTLAQGDEFSETFGTAGTFAYHCTIHPSMTGTVTVEG